MGEDRPYVPRLFTGASDRYDTDRWRRLWDGFGLDDMGSICCSECGAQLHSYMASRDDPGYNEHVGDGYIIFNDEVAICGGCLYDAFDSIQDAVDNYDPTD